jgi:hypothetical protein
VYVLGLIVGVSFWFFFGVGALLIVGYVMLGWKRRGMGKIAWVYICLFGDSMGGKT